MRAGAAHRVSDLELASRLSFFLWSSIPDDQLLNLAAAGQLRQPGVLAAQVKRMMADERADALVSNFTGQWLQLRNLDQGRARLLMFPDFDDNIRQALPPRNRAALRAHRAREPQRARAAERRLHVRQRAAGQALRHPGVYGERFRQVKLTDPNRRGLLGHGSMLSLTVGRHAHVAGLPRQVHPDARSSNTPPPPPPPNVPALEESSKDAATRAEDGARALELHRKNPTCAACHRIIDPLGFALENFDAVGQWRDDDADGAPIDTAGVLADGTQVDGPVALREAILEPARRVRRPSLPSGC